MKLCIFPADKRVSLFVTHGGLGSTTEVAYLGKPAIFVGYRTLIECEKNVEQIDFILLISTQRNLGSAICGAAT